MGAGTATAAITIGTDPEGAGKQAGTDVAAVGRTDGAERWVRCTFSDDANLRNGGCGVMSLSSCVLARFPCGCGQSLIGESASCGSSLLFTSPSYQRCEDAPPPVRLGGIPSTVEITSCVRISGSCDVMGSREWMSCAAARRVGDVGSETRAQRRIYRYADVLVRTRDAWTGVQMEVEGTVLSSPLT